MILGSDDLRRAELRGGEAIEDARLALGRITLEPLVEKQAIRQASLGRVPPRGHSIVSLPLAPAYPELRPARRSRCS